MDTARLVLWIVFGVVVVVMLVLDLGVFHRKAHAIRFREALAWSAVWVGMALAFNAAVYYWMGSQAGSEFLTAYLIEESLSIDNLFVFAVIFGYFNVPAPYQHRVLYWGIIGALVMRGVMIVAGVAILEALHWMVYVFGAFLVITSFKLATSKEMEVHPERNLVVKLFRRVCPTTEGYEGSRLFIRRNGTTYATVLFVVLLVVETTDLIFAVDSIPAVLSISRDPFIVYTSNGFAVLGLRAIFFVVVGVLSYFRYLKLGLSAVLLFVGLKMMLSDIYELPVEVSLPVVGFILAMAMVASVIRERMVIRQRLE